MYNIITNLNRNTFKKDLKQAKPSNIFLIKWIRIKESLKNEGLKIWTVIRVPYVKELCVPFETEKTFRKFGKKRKEKKHLESSSY